MSGSHCFRCFPLPVSGWPVSFLSLTDPDTLTRPPPVILRAFSNTISFSHPFSRRKSAASRSKSSTLRVRLVTVCSIFNTHCFFLFRNRAVGLDQLVAQRRDSKITRSGCIPSPFIFSHCCLLCARVVFLLWIGRVAGEVCRLWGWPFRVLLSVCLNSARTADIRVMLCRNLRLQELQPSYGRRIQLLVVGWHAG